MIIPTFENLVRYRNKKIRINPGVYLGGAIAGGVGDCRKMVVLIDDPVNVGGLYLSVAEPGAPNPGVFVTYMSTKATYGTAIGAENWGVTGPFSGCRVEAGYKSDGSKYLAHIAVDADLDTRPAWIAAHEPGATFDGANVLLRGRVERHKGNADAFVFVVWENAGLKATQVERRSKNIKLSDYYLDKIQKIVVSVR